MLIALFVLRHFKSKGIIFLAKGGRMKRVFLVGALLLQSVMALAAHEFKQLAIAFFKDKRVMALGAVCIGGLLYKGIKRSLFSAEAPVEVVQQVVQKKDIAKPKLVPGQVIQWLCSCRGMSYSMLAERYKEACKSIALLNELACQREQEMDYLLHKYKRLQLVLYMSGLKEEVSDKVRIACKWKELAQRLLIRAEDE